MAGATDAATPGLLAARVLGDEVEESRETHRKTLRAGERTSSSLSAVQRVRDRERETRSRDALERVETDRQMSWSLCTHTLVWITGYVASHGSALPSDCT